MSAARRFLSRWVNFGARRDGGERLRQEIQEHIALQTADNVRAGLSPAEARRQALLKFGAFEAVREDYRAERSLPWIETTLQDLRHGLRTLRKSPGFTTVAILTLALGIGANTAIFSLVDCLVLRPLAIAHPEQVVFVASSWKDGGIGTTFSYPDVREIEEQTSSIFSEITATQPFQMDGVSGDGKSQSMWSSYVTGNFFGALGVKPALGRLLLPSEGKVAGADPVLVLSYAYWKSRFNVDPGIVGREVALNGRPVTIVGVAPRGFRGLTSLLDSQGYLPLAMAAYFKDAPVDFLTTRQSASFAVVARRRPGVSLREAESALQVAARRLSRENPQLASLSTLRAVPLGPAGLAINPGHPETLALVSGLFLALAASVLVLACMNIANLLLVRAANRQREMAMRAALGATRLRLIRYFLTESVLLAIAGGVAGVILGLAATRAVSSIPLHTAVPVVLDFGFDWRVFAYSFAAAFFTGILAGIVPALRASRGDVNKILHEGGRTSTPVSHRLRRGLVAAQIAGSLMLIVVAGLFVRSLEEVRHSDLGFNPSGLLNATLDPHEAGFDESQTREFLRSLLQRARALPAVQSASLAAAVPMGYYNLDTQLAVPGYQPSPGERPRAGYNVVSPGYFATMRIPMLRGRDFRDSDAENSPRVAIVSQTMAQRYWRGLDPIGQLFTGDDPNHPRVVVGVVGNVRSNGIVQADAFPFFYVPFLQSDQTLATLQVRTAGPMEPMAREVTSLVASLEPAMPVFDVQPMAAALQTLNGFLIFQFAAALAACLGILGLVLAVVGVYGVISYAAEQRTHEIGVRLALGAQPAHALRMILRQGLAVVGLGVFAGLLAAAAAARLVGNFLVGVRPLDPITYSAASLLLAFIALVACYIPARRAMHVDPIVALRHE